LKGLLFGMAIRIPSEDTRHTFAAVRIVWTVAGRVLLVRIFFRRLMSMMRAIRVGSCRQSHRPFLAPTVRAVMLVMHATAQQRVGLQREQRDDGVKLLHGLNSQ
jgi:uncharacterized membrane protein